MQRALRRGGGPLLRSLARCRSERGIGDEETMHHARKAHRAEKRRYFHKGHVPAPLALALRDTRHVIRRAHLEVDAAVMRASDTVDRIA